MINPVQCTYISSLQSGKGGVHTVMLIGVGLATKRPTVWLRTANDESTSPVRSREGP